jgi:flavodoxin
MNKIFIYYSLSGNGEVVADYLKTKKIDIRKVKTSEELPKNNILRILAGGFLAGINHKDKLIDFDNNIEKYGEVIIGSPIWNGKLSCPINTVLDVINLKDKKLTFILYSGSGKAPKTEKKLKEKYKDIKIINIKEPKKNDFKEILNKELL